MAIAVVFVQQQEEIAQTQCKNRFRPGSACRGKCVLAQRLAAEAQNKERSCPLPAAQRILLETTPFILPVSTPDLLQKPASDNRENGFHYQPLTARLLTGDVFHPPQWV